MDLLEYEGKQLVGEAGVAVPRSTLVSDPAAAQRAATAIGGKVVLKSQVPTGKRGKLGGIDFAAGGAEAGEVAQRLLGADIGGHVVHELLVEECVDIRSELYAAILNDPNSKGPLVLFSDQGGMDVEEVEPGAIRSLAVDIRVGLNAEAVRGLVAVPGLADEVVDQVVTTLLAAYRLYRDVDATLVEINPLAVGADGRVIALDSKVSLDPAAIPRHAELLSGLGMTGQDPGTDLEREGKQLGLQYMELDGDVGVLANGAGLTMTTVDAVRHYGGRAANFLEIGGDAYTKATPALRLVLSNPRVRSLVVNFCGAFARTDVMAEGVVAALEELKPRIPVFFTIHGTGEDEAVALVRERLGATPFDRMDDAVRAAVAAAGEQREVMN
ncbi:acetate--CoA ligase family protein [Saccharopolyspora sp. WRP15-2]|uniref:Acetate--CoA ligase family protein n=1 Tax=Saccharopolyspora oryzae TaxID=2997343 RepID=A0ABT4UVD0_9PSEU|nr:ATP-grasp domain-containing protein [Saccharopolyspora oryzae]MDA3625671.1 acetate--CoA ligase family protein [Saccharopolyspora oryzae]